MKKALLVLFYSLMSVMLYGQGFAVSANKMNVVYIGVDNPLTIAAENCDCNKLEVSTTNGTIQKTEGCEYNFKPEAPGKYDIKVKIKTTTGVKNLGSVTYRVKYIPDPYTFLGKRNHSGAPLLLTLGVMARLDDFDFDVKFVVKDFTFGVESTKGSIDF